MSKHFAIGVVMAALCLILVGCGGSDGPNLQPQVDELRDQLGDLEGTLEEAQDEAEAQEQRADIAEARLDEARRGRQQAEEDAEQAEQQVQQVQQEAQQQVQQVQQEAQQQVQQAQQQARQQIEEAQQQANVAVRAPLLRDELTGDTVDDAGTVMGVGHARGESRVFKRPLNLPSKGSAPSVPGGWSSASYSGPRGNVGTDTVYLYTNIQAPSSKVFWKEHGESVASTATDFATTAKPSGFTTTAKKLFPDENGVAVTKENASRSGTYDGYSGTFKCATGCNIEAADGGALTFTGDWTFTANLTARRASSQAEQDTEFLYFGIWAYEPTSASDTPDFKWARGGDSNEGDAAIGNFTSLTGTATFTGGAIGKYALAKVGGRTARIGTFTATATFTADFDKAPDGTDGNRISGRITEFKEEGTSLGSDWHVFLGSSVSAAAGLDASGTTGTPTTHGAIDGDDATGTWAATLHGSDNHVFTDRDKYPASQYPVADLAGVAGWFSAAAGTNAAIAGAFGAACTTGSMCAK